jgi:hypothetical protein
MTEKVTKILEKLEIEGRNGNKFLVLKTNPMDIYVFSDGVPEEE